MTPPELGNTYRAIRDDSVQAIIDVRSGKSERELIQRMLARHELTRNGVSENLEPRQLTLNLPRRGAGAAETSAPHSTPSVNRPPRRQDMPTAQPVPSSDDGSYVRPPSIQQTIAEKLRRLPRVDANGRDLPPATADPTVTELVTPPTAPPSLAQAVSRAAEAVGADLPALLDSQSFCAELGEISPSDSLGLEDVVRRHMPAPVAPGMQPNPLQGGGGGVSVPTPPRGSTMLELAHQLAHGSTPPLPEGYTPVR